MLKCGALGETERSHPTRNLENCGRNLVLSSKGIASEKRKNSKEYVVKIFEKSQCSIEILIKKEEDFLENFQDFFIFGPNASSFAGT